MDLSHRSGSRSKTAKKLEDSSSDDSRSSPAVVVPPRYSGFAFNLVILLVLASISSLISCLFFQKIAEFLHISSDYSSMSPRIFPSLNASATPEIEEPNLEDVLRNAAMSDNTVILTTLNEAWAAPGSILDLFLESFRIGEGTENLLNHLAIIAVDDKAYSRCKVLHKHCYRLETEGIDFSNEAYFMTSSYLKMMWTRIDFLRRVLELGYSFIFTDADVMWFRNPFQRFYNNIDFQIACDHYLGKSNDPRNRPNGGFNFVRSNNKTIDFYKFWYESRLKYPAHHDQDVLNFIKTDPYIVSKLRLTIRYLNTAYFGGFCEPSRDLNAVCTMHANCCFGMVTKLHDLRIMLQDWRDFKALPLHLKKSGFSWKVPQNCRLDSLLGDMFEEESETPKAS